MLLRESIKNNFTFLFFFPYEIYIPQKIVIFNIILYGKMVSKEYNIYNDTWNVEVSPKIEETKRSIHQHNT